MIRYILVIVTALLWLMIVAALCGPPASAVDCRTLYGMSISAVCVVEREDVPTDPSRRSTPKNRTWTAPRALDLDALDAFDAGWVLRLYSR